MATQSAPILVTRPLAEGKTFAADLVARFGARVRPLVSPLLAPRNLMPDLPGGGHVAVIFTSAQAVAAVQAFAHQLPRLAWCVGNRTARAASAAGFQARSADGDAKALLNAIAADPPDGSILYLRGVDTSYNILEELRNLSLHADEAVVYVQEPQSLTPEAITLLQTPTDVIIPVFSPRTARLFCASLPKPTRARLHFAAMSANVADALRGLPHARLTIAAHPSAEAMLDAVETLLVDLPPP